MEPSDYLKINQDSWDRKTALHVGSSFYNLREFKAGQNSLNDIEVGLLGSVENKSILHLQCHFGMDSLSLSRMGARVTGIDLSPAAIEKAKELAEELQLSSTFICDDVYNAPNHISEDFDIVFTSYGTIGWLPDLEKWAQVISHSLKKGGKLVFVEFHPFIWMYDPDFKRIDYAYFKTKPIIETEQGSYADKNSNEQISSITWNHSLSEVFNALKKSGLRIEDFQEYNYSPYPIFNDGVEVSSGKFMVKGLEYKLPLIYSLIATKSI